MKPWHEKALKRGRTPLPEGPDQRPWSPLQPSERLSTNSEVLGASQDPNHAEDAYQPRLQPKPANPSYRFWEESEQAFPNRTLEALKQTFHKRRHAVEQKIGEEKPNESLAEKDQIKSSA
ncbi:hypothetical protein FVEG_07221 [Fusarium verticillioides 7600]|uniref:Uncharacterized protein n=1 Tax=Gibberella moniliformis (strain M3125 / FGSC 7600) TaxID=334819 RepID=W7M5X5_GIBM7|nr:hypothetical protein FVEG_07221 [Fusarium verticillioides 7600]EWG46958.1 hypothetical protein FVEG_07221 [Fusarium verticillioides 7600]